MDNNIRILRPWQGQLHLAAGESEWVPIPGPEHFERPVQQGEFRFAFRRNLLLRHTRGLLFRPSVEQVRQAMPATDLEGIRALRFERVQALPSDDDPDSAPLRGRTSGHLLAVETCFYR